MLYKVPTKLPDARDNNIPTASVGKGAVNPATTNGNPYSLPKVDKPATSETENTEVVQTPKQNWFAKKQAEANDEDKDQQREQAQQEADARRYAPKEVGSADVSSNFSDTEGLDGNLDERIDNIIQQTAESGGNANAAMQNIKVPRNKMLTIRDIMKDPELEGMRDYLVADKIGTMWQNVGENIAGRAGNYKSKLDEYNDAMNQTYAQNKANVDKTATQANLDAINTGLAQQVALETSLADTVANEYIQRYKSQQDAESKKLLLQKMATDSDVWASLEDDEKLNLAGYMGILSGNYSLTELLIQKYAPQMLSLLDAFMDKVTDGQWSNWRKTNTNTGNPDAQPQPTQNPEKKNDTPVNVKNYKPVPSARPVDLKDYEANPEDYILFPTGNLDENGEEEYIISRKAGDVDATTGNENLDTIGWDVYIPSEEELDELADVLMNNPKLSDPQRLKYAEQWGSNKLSADRARLRNKVTNKIAARKEKERVQQKKHDDLFDLQKKLNNGKLDPNSVLNKLWNYPANELSDEDRVLRQQIVESAYKKQAKQTYDTVLADEKMSPSNKIKAYDTILNGPAKDYINPVFRKQVERARDDSVARRDYIDPLNNVSNTWFGKNKTVGSDGLVHHGKSIFNPSERTYYTASGVEKDLGELESLIYKIQDQLSGADPQYYHLYVSKSNIGAYLKRYYDNGSMKKVVEKAGEDSKVYEHYDQIMYAIGNLIKE